MEYASEKLNHNFSDYMSYEPKERKAILKELGISETQLKKFEAQREAANKIQYAAEHAEYERQKAAHPGMRQNGDGTWIPQTWPDPK